MWRGVFILVFFLILLNLNWVADKITRQQNVVGFICLKSKTIPVYCIKII